MQPTDALLVRQALEGNKNAFGQLVQRYQSIVYGLAYHLTHNASEAQDLAQEAFLQAYLKLDQLREPMRFAHWLRRITANLCKMWLRRTSPETTSWECLKVDASPDALTTSDIQAWELRHAVENAVDTLSEKNRLAVTLYYMDGLSQREISDFLDVPLGTIKSRLHDARKQLQKELMKRGLGQQPSATMVQESLQSQKLPDEFHRQVEQMLQDADAVVRRKAVHALQEHHSEDPTVEDLILDAVQDTDPQVREKAVQVLGQLRCEKAIPQLVESLSDPNFQIRKRAEWSLNRIGTEPVVSELLSLLDSPEVVTRRHAVDALQGICPEAAIPRFLNALTHDLDTGVRERILDVLGEMEHASIAEALVGLLSDEEPRIRRKATDALRRMKPTHIAPTLLRKLDETDAELQQRAIDLLGTLKYKAAEDALIGKLESPEPEIASCAAIALGKMRSEKAVEPLVNQLRTLVTDRTKQGRQVTIPMIQALGQIGHSAALPTLVDCWEWLLAQGGPAGELRWMAKAFGGIGDASVVPLLTEYLDTYRAIPHTSQREDSQWQWGPMREILEALGRIGDPTAVGSAAQLVEAGYFIGEEAVMALGHLGPDAIPALSEVLLDRDRPVSRWHEKRWRAAQSLGKIGHPDVLEPLSTVLEDEERAVRFHAIQALGKLNTQEAIVPLQRALEDKDAGVAKAAVDALKQLGVSEKELPDLSRRKHKPASETVPSPEQFRGWGMYEQRLHLPAKDSDRRAVLTQFLEQHFEEGKVYTELQVNEIIHRVYEDHCTVRRYLVDYGMMSREKGQYVVVTNQGTV